MDGSKEQAMMRGGEEGALMGRANKGEAWSGRTVNLLKEVQPTGNPEAWFFKEKLKSFDIRLFLMERGRV